VPTSISMPMAEGAICARTEADGGHHVASVELEAPFGVIESVV